MLDTEQPWRVSIDGAVTSHFIDGVSPPCRCFLGGHFVLLLCSAIAVGRAAAPLLLSFVLLLCSFSRSCYCCYTTFGSYRSCCFSTHSRFCCMTCSLLVRSLLERLLI